MDIGINRIIHKGEGVVKILLPSNKVIVIPATKIIAHGFDSLSIKPSYKKHNKRVI
jgi:hypothetical protein